MGKVRTARVTRGSFQSDQRCASGLILRCGHTPNTPLAPVGIKTVRQLVDRHRHRAAVCRCQEAIQPEPSARVPTVDVVHVVELSIPKGQISQCALAVGAGTPGPMTAVRAQCLQPRPPDQGGLDHGFDVASLRTS